MRGPKAVEIKLTEIENKELEKLVKAYKTGQQIVLRGWIIQEAGKGKSNTQIGKELGVTVDTVRLWRKRWKQLEAIPLEEMSVKERLEDLPRPGCPPKITADQRCQLEALACEKPEGSGRPISQWTHRELADEMVKRGIVTKISPRHVGRLLKRSEYQTPSDPILVNSWSR